MTTKVVKIMSILYHAENSKSTFRLYLISWHL